MVTPLTTTLRWVETYLDELSHGADEISARLGADRITEVSGKSFARLFLPDTILTIPVEGGAAILKRRNANISVPSAPSMAELPILSI